MFGKTRVSQSMLDAVNSVIGEEPIVENKKAKSMLSEEGPAITPETLKGQILKKKDDKKASLGKPAIAMSAEEVELDEEGNCVTPMKAKKIADKEVGKHEKEMHKEDMTFKERLLEKSVSTKQARTMAAAAHNPKFAKKVGIPQDVAKDFNQADKGTKMLSKAMSEEIELDETSRSNPMYKKHVTRTPGSSFMDKAKSHGKNLSSVIKDLQGERDSIAKEHGYKHAIFHDTAIGAFKSAQKILGKEEVVDEAAESPFTSYKDKTKPSIFAPKSHTPKKTSTGTVYTKNWSKKDQKPDDEKTKNEAVDKEADQHVRVDGETDMKTKTVDGLRGRMKVPADYHNKSKSYKVALTVGEEVVSEEHDDEKEDKALVKKMVKKDALKQTDEAFKGPEAGSGVGDHPFVTAEAKPLKNARELAKKTMHRIKNEMLGKISN